MIRLLNKRLSLIYKASLIICIGIIIFVVGHFVLAEGKGYFYERGNEFNIFDNLIVNGYLIVENNKTDRVGFPGDVLIDNNFSLDINSKIYFCKDEKVGETPLNKNCDNKVIIWYPDNLEAVEDNFYQIQTNKILALNKVINIDSATDVRALKQIRLTGCFSNDGSQSCVLGGTCNGGVNNGFPSAGGCPPNNIANLGEVKTTNFYVDNMTNLSLKTSNINTIKVIANTLKYANLNLGSDVEVDFQKKITINNKTKLPKLDLQNICWKYNVKNTIPCGSDGFPAYGGYNIKWDFGNSVGLYVGADDLKICCFLDVSPALD
jgi:hypothetical protein